jgi:hypothetical protein
LSVVCLAVISDVPLSASYLPNSRKPTIHSIMKATTAAIAAVPSEVRIHVIKPITIETVPQSRIAPL